MFGRVLTQPRIYLVKRTLSGVRRDFVAVRTSSGGWGRWPNPSNAGQSLRSIVPIAWKSVVVSLTWRRGGTKEKKRRKEGMSMPKLWNRHIHLFKIISSGMKSIVWEILMRIIYLMVHHSSQWGISINQAYVTFLRIIIEGWGKGNPLFCTKFLRLIRCVCIVRYMLCTHRLFYNFSLFWTRLDKSFLAQYDRTSSTALPELPWV